MMFCINANNQSEILNNPSLLEISKLRVKMAMNEEGYNDVKKYTQDFVDVLIDIASESEDNPSKDPKYWLEYIAENLVYTNTDMFVIDGKRLEICSENKDRIHGAIHKFLLRFF